MKTIQVSFSDLRFPEKFLAPCFLVFFGVALFGVFSGISDNILFVSCLYLSIGCLIVSSVCGVVRNELRKRGISHSFFSWQKSKPKNRELGGQHT